MRTLVVVIAAAACGGGKQPARAPLANEQSPPVAARATPDEPTDPAELGRLLYERKGCVACHTVDGSPKVGPSWKGIWNTVVRLDDGSDVKIDESYVRESILAPSAKTVAGYPHGVMPSFDGQLTERQLRGLTSFIKSLE